MKNPHIVAVWSDPVLDEGYCVVPNIILDQQSAIGITSDEINLLFQVFRFKFDERLPFPSEKTLAHRMGVSQRKVRRISASMREKKFLKKSVGRDRTTWDFNGLVSQAVKAWGRTKLS